MRKHFVCGDCGANFDYPVVRFDNGLKVCPACLSYVTEDAWALFLKKIKWFRKQILKNNNTKKLFDSIFPIYTKLIFDECTEEV